TAPPSAARTVLFTTPCSSVTSTFGLIVRLLPFVAEAAETLAPARTSAGLPSAGTNRLNVASGRVKSLGPTATDNPSSSADVEIALEAAARLRVAAKVFSTIRRRVRSETRTESVFRFRLALTSACEYLEGVSVEGLESVLARA